MLRVILNKSWHDDDDPTQQNYIYLFYMDKQDLALNNLQGLICHKIKQINEPSSVVQSLK